MQSGWSGSAHGRQHGERLRHGGHRGDRLRPRFKRLPGCVATGAVAKRQARAVWIMVPQEIRPSRLCKRWQGCSNRMTVVIDGGIRTSGFIRRAEDLRQSVGSIPRRGNVRWHLGPQGGFCWMVGGIESGVPPGRAASCDARPKNGLCDVGPAERRVTS